MDNCKWVYIYPNVETTCGLTLNMNMVDEADAYMCEELFFSFCPYCGRQIEKIV